MKINTQMAKEVQLLCEVLRHFYSNSLGWDIVFHGEPRCFKKAFLDNFEQFVMFFFMSFLMS